MAAGAFSDEFVLRSTEPTRKEEKKKNTNNFAVPGPRPYAQGNNRPFGLSPFTLITVPFSEFLRESLGKPMETLGSPRESRGNLQGILRDP